MKNKITLFILSLLFTTAMFAQEKRETKFIKIKESSKHQLQDASKLIKEKLRLTSDDDLIKIKSKIDQLGFTHEEYQQYFNSVKVEFGKYKAHAKNGNIQTLNGEIFSVGKLNVSPTLSSQSAFQKAIASVGAEKYLWDFPEEAKLMDDYKKPTGELLILPAEIFKGDKARLTYKFDVYAISPISRENIYVDAHTGEVVYKDAIIKHIDRVKIHSSNKNVEESISTSMLVTGTAATKYSGSQSIETTYSGGNYRLRETTRGNGIETYNMEMGINYNNAVDFTDNDNNWTSAEHSNSDDDDAALDAHWGAEKTYDYFYQTFNRNSYDDNGSKIKSYVHFDLVEYGYSNQDNAFWNGSVMTYGDGTSLSPLTSIDIAAHEIGHAVCENTADLTYSYESGAMNEGFSDIWAACVEYYADPTKDTWLLGEEIGGPIRSLSNPNDYGQPDTYKGTNWFYGSADYGGVHYNSGVLNHWFYILTIGKSGTNDNGDSYSVTGIGIDKAAAISYRLESVYLSSGSQYADARTYGIQAAEDLYGADSAEAVATTNAFYAVGIGSEYVQTCSLGAPSNLASSSIGDNGFTISWSTVSGAANYTVTIGGSSTTVSSTTYTASSLTEGTTYSVSVVANCSTGGSGSSSSIDVTTTGTAPVTYCDSASTNISDEYIGRVQLNTIDNSSGGQYYSDFTSVSTSLNKGDSYTITVTPTWTGTVYSEGYSVWIDYNQDGDFDDSGEQVWTQSATKTTPVSGTFTVSSSASSGSTRMRVSMKYNAIPTSCETFNYGEVEDYTVNLGDGTPDTTAPVITLVGDAIINLSLGDSYTEQGAIATDNVDGDVSANIVVGGDTVNIAVEGTYVVTYNVSDAAGNAASEVTRTVNVFTVQDTTAPVITLTGSATINLEVGDTYNELGATATDDTDGDLTSSIVVTGTVDTSVVGTYIVYYNVSDAAGNAATQVTRTIIVSDSSTGSTTTLHEGYFESGWDGWSDGGSDCARVSSSRSYEGSYSIRIRDNSGTESAMTSESFDLSSYDSVEVEFYFYPNSMESGEDFWLRFYNGSSWSTVASYASGTDFNNNTYYVATVTLDAASFNFASDSQFRFQCDASGNADRIYVDQVTIKGIIGSGFIPNVNSIVDLGGMNYGIALDDSNETDFEYDFKMYPNPVKNVLNIELVDAESATFRITNLLGQTVKSGILRQQGIDVSSLQDGIYVIEVNDGDENMIRKFIKQ